MQKKVSCMLLLSIFVFFCFQAAAQPVAQGQTMQTLSAEIHAQLESLRRHSQLLTEQLMIAESELQASSKQAEALQTELRDLNSCLDNTKLRLIDYSTRLTQYELKLKFRAKIILIATVLLAIFIIVRVVLLVLKIRYGIKIPYLLNLLL